MIGGFFDFLSPEKQWEELKATVSLLRQRAGRLTQAFNELVTLEKTIPATSPNKAKAQALINEYGTVSTVINAVMTKYRQILDALGIQDSNMGAIPIVAIALIAAAIPIATYGLKTVSTMLDRVLTFTAGEKAARLVIEKGGSAEQANAARSTAITVATNTELAKQREENANSGLFRIFGLDKNTIILLAIAGGVGYYLWKKKGQ